MKDITKTLLRIILWLLLVVFIVSLVFNLFNMVSSKFNGIFGPDTTVERVPLSNGLGSLTNGGLSPKEFEEQRKDEDAPYSGDEVKNFYIRETDKYVIFSREATFGNSNVYPNISFVKTDRGLVWDGAFSVTADLNVNWWTGKRYFETITFREEMLENTVIYSKLPRNLIDLIFSSSSNWVTNIENIVTFSDFNASFCPNFYHYNVFAALWVNNENDKNILFNKVHEWLLNNILVPYFEMLDDGIEFEMGNDDAETLSKLNACFTYLWNNCKTEDLTSKETIVDISKYYGKIISEEEREKYPIPEDKQELYGNKKYYSAYYCKVFASCYYSYYDNIKVERNEEKIKDYVKDYSVDEVPENQTIDYSQLTIKFVNKDNSDLTYLSLKDYPVKVNINDVVLTFDNLKDLTNGKSVVVQKGKAYSYTLTSDQLVFDSYSGVITANHNKVETYFKYSYMSGYVAVSVSLQPIMSVNPVNLDLSKEPFSFYFYSHSNLTNNFSFVFDSNEKLNETITKYIPIGEYDVALSGHSQIRCYFDGNSENINITPSNRKFIFRYSFNESSFKYGISPEVIVTKMQDEEGNYITTDTPNDFRFNCTMNNGYRALLRCYPNATEEDKFNISIKIFDNCGYVYAEIKDSHNAKNESSCSPNLIINSNFENGKTYSAQYFITTPDNEIFVSSPSDFIYESGYVYEISDLLTLHSDFVLEKENGGKNG